MTARTQAERALSALIGTCLWSAQRNGEMVAFHFSSQRPAGILGPSSQVGEFALSVSCPWRIVTEGRVLVASADLYYTPSDRDIDASEFDWRGQRNRFDELIAKFFEQEKRSCTVEEVMVGMAAAFTLTLAHGFFLQVFPEDRAAEEYWRLAAPENELLILRSADIQGESPL